MSLKEAAHGVPAERALVRAIECQHALAYQARLFERDDIAHLLAADQLGFAASVNLSRSGFMALAGRLERMASDTAEPFATRYGYAAAQLRSFAEFYL